MKIKGQTLQSIVLCLLFLMSINFFQLQGLLLIIFIFLSFLVYKHTKIDLNLVMLIFFSISYFINLTIYKSATINNIFLFLIAPWYSYFFAKSLIAANKNNEKLVCHICFIIIFGYFIHGLLNLISYLNIYGFNYNFRITYDFWTHTVNSVTSATLFLTGMSSFAIGYLFYGKRTKLKIFLTISLSICIFASAIYRNRTFFLIILLLLLVGFLFKFFQKKFVVKKNTIVKFFAIIFLIFAIFKIFNLSEAITNTAIYKRFENPEYTESRLDLWVDFLEKNPFNYPLGGKKIYLKYGWVHNVCLDMLNDVGIFPFMLFLLFLFILCKKCLQFLKMKTDETKKQMKHEYVMPVIFTIIGMLINFMVEPIIDANPYIFISFIMISSMFICYVNSLKKGE